MQVEVGTPVEDPGIEAMRIAYLFLSRLPRDQQLAALAWLESRLGWDARQPAKPPKQGTCDGCSLDEHPSDPVCDWHWNKPPESPTPAEGGVATAQSPSPSRPDQRDTEQHDE